MLSPHLEKNNLRSSVSACIKTVLPAFALVFLFTRLNYSILPLSWPDEALFSSPAAELASHGVFATNVLKGLIPGMERATLWNSPFYMVITAGVYRFTGESQLAARTVSLFFALASLFLLYSISLKLLPGSPKLQALTVYLAAFDLTFLRAANTARMDMLTLTWILAGLYFLIREYCRRDPSSAFLEPPGRRAKWDYFLTGICAGLALSSHPAGGLLLPVIFIFSLPAVRLWIYSAAGFILAMAPWGIYIFSNFALFRIQFVSQLLRKSDIMHIWGGDTGGILVVFSSQYGGRAAVMILALLSVALTVAVGLNELRKSDRWKIEIDPRLLFSFIVIFFLVLIASEGWYALFVGPFAVILSAVIALHSDSKFSRVALGAWLIFLPLSFVVFSARNYLQDTAGAARDFEKSALASARKCRSIYLRVRPDPYFLLRREYPAMEVREFVPGKLQLPDMEKNLTEQYRQLDCFLIDNHHDWEPILSRYLQENRELFRVIPISSRPPQEEGSLWLKMQ